MKRIVTFMVFVVAAMLAVCTTGAQAQETTVMKYPQAEWTKAGARSLSPEVDTEAKTVRFVSPGIVLIVF